MSVFSNNLIFLEKQNRHSTPVHLCVHRGLATYLQNQPHALATPRVLNLNEPPHERLLAWLMAGEARNPEQKRCHKPDPSI